MQVQSYLFFNGRCEEAIEFYQRAIGAKVEMLMRHKDVPEPDATPPPGMANKVLHAAFRIGDTMVLASDGRAEGTPARFEGFSLAISAPNRCRVPTAVRGPGRRRRRATAADQDLLLVAVRHGHRPLRRVVDGPYGVRRFVGSAGARKDHACDVPERVARVPARTSGAAGARGGAAGGDGGGGGPVERAAAGRRGARGLLFRLHRHRPGAIHRALVGAVPRRRHGDALPLHVPSPCRGHAARADARAHGAAAVGRGTVSFVHRAHRHVGGNNASFRGPRRQPRGSRQGSDRARRRVRARQGLEATSGYCRLPTAASSATITERTPTVSRSQS